MFIGTAVVAFAVEAMVDVDWSELEGVVVEVAVVVGTDLEEVDVDLVEEGIEVVVLVSIDLVEVESEAESSK